MSDERELLDALERIATVDMGGGFLGALACRKVANEAIASWSRRADPAPGPDWFVVGPELVEAGRVLERAFVVAVGEKSPFAKLALKPLRQALARAQQESEG